MKTKKEMLNQVARKLTHRMIQADSAGWPPDSPAGYYQPVRPQKRETSILEDTPPRHESHKM
ncbi:MAG: hypothetical protein ACI4EG_06165 [Fusicatenibacter sp.]